VSDDSAGLGDDGVTSDDPATPLRQLPGMQAAGQVLLPNQWSLRPAGNHIMLGDFPVHLEFHPSEPFAAILHAGYGDHEVQIFDLGSREIISRVNIPQTFYGMCFSPDGGRLYVSGAAEEVIYQFEFERGFLTRGADLAVESGDEKVLVGGLAIDRGGKTLYAACPWGDAVSKIDTATDSGATQSRLLFPQGTFPYTCLPSLGGDKLFVSLWGAAAIAVVDPETMQLEKQYKTESHPTEMVLSPQGDLLYVACANSNSVTVIDLRAGRSTETIRSSLYPTAPNGSTPNALALSGDGNVLCVANADNNNIALIDVSKPGKSRSLGFIPTGWYPTSVRIEPQQGTIYVVSGKGLSSKANRLGPNPLNDPPRGVREYIAGLFRGSLSVVSPPDPQRMAAYTRAAFQCSPLREDLAPRTAQRSDGNPIPASVGDPSPIKHCIYIIKENRTYDQVFGDLPAGNGDPDLCIFPRRVTPNHHALAEQFVLLDNFYVESEVSADGHEWTMAAYANDFVEKSWPLSYRGSSKIIGYPSEGSYEIATPAGGYLWDRCREAGVSYRSYGEFIQNGRTVDDPSTAKLPALEGHFDPGFRGYDLDYLDIDRAERFLEQWRQFDSEGTLPQMTILRLGNDHTYGTRPGKRTPTAMVADNDLALGRVVEGVSNSKAWPETAIFVVQDDAQNGSDHVDAHRTVALAISPYTRRGIVDSTMYSTASMLRTMELILGLRPMSQFDAAARPMYNSFAAEPDLTPYTHLPAQVDLQQRNESTAWGAADSLRMDFTKEDAADDLLLNEVVWRSVRGADSPMPPPVRAAFVFAHQDDDDDDDFEDEDDRDAEE
jgi:DNA-binding beta-propeller fold protein YncE